MQITWKTAYPTFLCADGPELVAAMSGSASDRARDTTPTVVLRTNVCPKSTTSRYRAMLCVGSGGLREGRYAHLRGRPSPSTECATARGPPRGERTLNAWTQPCENCSFAAITSSPRPRWPSRARVHAPSGTSPPRGRSCASPKASTPMAPSCEKQMHLSATYCGPEQCSHCCRQGSR